MKPKIFVSSTYYDMKYIRESIENLLRNLGFDSILFESGGVTFEHDKPLDSSCYSEVKNCNMMMLIVGGRYGSEATAMGLESYSEKYEKYYTSITKSEFLTARKRGIPVYVFIEGNVLTEFETFKKNRDTYYRLEKPDSANKLVFAFVDSVNVFEFISELYLTGLPIFRFSRFEDIESQFKAQISGMLYLYLESLINQKSENKVSESVDSIKNLIERMEKMVQQIGEKVLENDKVVLEKIKEEQGKTVIDFCLKKISANILTSDGDGDASKPVWNDFAKFLLDEYLLKDELSEYLSKKYKKDVGAKLNAFHEDVQNRAEKVLNKYGLKVFSIDFMLIEEMSTNVTDYAKSSEAAYDYVVSKFADNLSDNWLPF